MNARRSKRSLVNFSSQLFLSFFFSFSRVVKMCSSYVNDDLIPIGELGQKVISRRKDGDEASADFRYKRSPISREVLTSSTAIRVHESLLLRPSSPTPSIVPSIATRIRAKTDFRSLPPFVSRFALQPSVWTRFVFRSLASMTILTSRRYCQFRTDELRSKGPAE